MIKWVRSSKIVNLKYNSFKIRMIKFKNNSINFLQKWKQNNSFKFIMTTFFDSLIFVNIFL
jgi:hypothetical protein